MDTIVRKWGNSLGIRIPRIIAQELRLEDGTRVEITKKANGILIILGNKSRLLRKLELVTEMNLHHEVATGKPIGHEAW